MIWKIPELSCCCTNTLLSLFSANFVQSTLILYQIDPCVNTPSIWGTHWFYVCLVFWHQIVKKGPGGAQRKPSKMRKSGLPWRKKNLMKQKWRNEEWRKSEETNEARSSLKLLLVKLPPALFWIPCSRHALYFLNLFLIFLKMNFYYQFG